MGMKLPPFTEITPEKRDWKLTIYKRELKVLVFKVFQKTIQVSIWHSVNVYNIISIHFKIEKTMKAKKRDIGVQCDGRA